MARATSDPPLPGPVKGLAAVSFFNDVASEMVYPVLPAFITRTLGGGPAVLGVLDGAADLAAATLRWWSGRVADRPRWRSPLIGAGYALAALLRPAMSLATGAWQVVSLRVLDRVGKGLRSPARDAFIADVTPAPIQGRAFGLHRSADHLGAVLGSLAAYWLLTRGASTRQVLGLSLFPGLLALVVLGLVLRPRPGFASAPLAGDDGADPPGPDPAQGALVALAGLAAVRLPETLLLLRLQDTGVAVAIVPLVWAMLHVVRSMASYPAGFLADRLGVRGSLVAGTVLYALVLAGLARPVGGDVAVSILLVGGVATGLLEPAERVAVVSLGVRRRGRRFGVYQGLAGIGSLGAGVLLGSLYGARGGPAALRVAALLALLSLLAWLMVSGGRGGSLAGPDRGR